MKTIAVLLAAFTFACICPAQTPTTNLSTLVGRKAITTAMPFYEPGTYQQLPNLKAGETVTIIAVTPLPDFAVADKTSSTIEVQFSDGTLADTGQMPVMAKSLRGYLKILPVEPAAAPASAPPAKAAAPATTVSTPAAVKVSIPPVANTPATATSAAVKPVLLK